MLQFAAHIAQQAGQQAFVHRFVAGRLAVFRPAVFGYDGVQLGVDVAPFAHAANADVVLPQQVFPLAVAEFVGGACRSSRGGRRCGDGFFCALVFVFAFTQCLPRGGQGLG